MKAIEINNIYKKFKVFHDRSVSIKERVLFRNRNYYEDRWVLSGISLTVEKGESLGLIGHNGCGKSTLLKLLTKIMYPDKGVIKMEGRVSSLIELGAGFHPDMSGRENIYINAAIFGLTRKEIDQRLEAIIEFSELEEFIDNPVRTYSSGMYMRLAFAVAINVDAEILLIDEILAVGDSNFQIKCFNRLRELKASGMTIVLVTHDSGTVENFCDKALWIHEGKAKSYGNSANVVDEYLSFMNDKRVENQIKKERKDQEKEETQEKTIVEKAAQTNISNQEEVKSKLEEIKSETEEAVIEEITTVESKDEIDTTQNRFGRKHIEIEKALLRKSDGTVSKILRTGERLTIEIYYKINKPLDEYVFGMGFYTIDGMLVYGNNTQVDHMKVELKEKQGIIKFEIEKLPLLSGLYILNVAIVDKNHEPMDFIRDYMHFEVVEEDRNIGIVNIEHRWVI